MSEVISGTSYQQHIPAKPFGLGDPGKGSRPHPAPPSIPQPAPELHYRQPRHLGTSNAALHTNSTSLPDTHANATERVLPRLRSRNLPSSCTSDSRLNWLGYASRRAAAACVEGLPVNVASMSDTCDSSSSSSSGTCGCAQRVGAGRIGQLQLLGQAGLEYLAQQ